MSADQNFGIEPSWLYRKSSEETRKILGLRPTQIDAAIASGDLPPPVRLTASGRACGWLGQTLIQLIRERQARAVTEQARKATKKKRSA